MIITAVAVAKLCYIFLLYIYPDTAHPYELQPRAFLFWANKSSRSVISRPDYSTATTIAFIGGVLAPPM